MSPFEHLPTSTTATTSKQASSTESNESADSSFPDHIQSLLTKYDVTTNGFLPEGPPLEVLPGEYYTPWEDLIRRLSESLDAGTFRAEVDRLPVLQTDRLMREEEWRRAYVVLCFFAHGYIWGGRRPSEILPAPISVPLLSVSKHLDLPPIATYASLNLWNFRCVPPPSSSLPPSPPATPASSSSPSPSLTTCKTAAAKTPKVFDPTDLSRLQTLHTFTGTPSESCFYLVSVAMEAQGAYIIPIMLRALQAIGLRAEAWKESTTKALRELVRCVQAVGELLERMYEGCESMVFYHRIRPYLAGSKGMNSTSMGLGRGVFYDLGPLSPAGSERKTGEKGEEGVEGEEVQGQKRKGKWMAYRGGSNGQSSLIQFWDLVLGVEHVSAGHSSPHGQASHPSQSDTMKEKEKPFHEEVREYMPLKHRQFLTLVSKMGLGKGGIRKAVMEMVEAAEHEGRELDDKEKELQGAFTDATRALAGFRNKHLQIVARYIVIPSRQAVPEGSKRPGASLGDGKVGGGKDGQVVNLATASSGLSQGNDDKKNEGPELTGTGGTALLPFLKQTRDETLKAGEVGR
ncbi:indoleamine 2,3-dioxygenase beta type [Neurospora crassa]|uniref:Indoleamine 2,3-dioxygenase n=2 Tax=Neurospora crassa TaxID=5141 RepID=U9W4G0_NEUCR|nr:indoleamine 2,3-dioxygenase [Neurospora crassa OR74A]ESA43124.1 indoleamine 2,3-dioxygenase [Neurospora crassa OR74A]KHE84335.1 indoleamine 2,3-dioxygenase beta type [Neurospora crassa]BAK81911.1 indoleamine 2,3-dioxygenase beta type [Neurospora crassa]|eukprot:XP_011393994.1 indoleamine 2,3-dioxygenase [Neurospora crassa OR74A]